MRHLINKHYDTHGGFSVILTNVSSHIQAPSVSLKDETMKQTIINSFIDKSVKAPSYEPNELTRKNFGDWITANPLGTYKEWKEYLELLVEGGDK